MGRGRKWIIASLVVLLAGACVYGGYFWYKWKKDHVYVVLKPIHTELGWGYDIWVDKARFMHQPFIPAIPGRHGFKTEKDALLVGQKIYDLIMAGQIPTISPEEIRDMGLQPDSTERARDSAGGNPDSSGTNPDSSVKK
jgi:Domain of unknown function (DUF4907)